MHIAMLQLKSLMLRCQRTNTMLLISLKGKDMYNTCTLILIV